ncbi:hypothetical protein [Bacillus sp. T33-2]|uniref:hypothetical protein n=1 Tax=Bacillus sp. T33-2 TaxID=2054168 RepID=UPI000C78CAC7|nr:hypothetical protein [Bacillus sp. T33-2]PLR99618.1 hypothetical protein CVD19_00720 [Bacillus sp. T33-2]
MKGKNDTSCYTEEEAIKITIENGYDGSEFNTTVWKQRGCLKPNRTLQALISKLQTIYNIVEITGTGKKRRYILTGIKDQVSDRKFNYKGSVLTVEDETMKEYIFNSLILSNNHFSQSYKSWSKYLGFIDTNSFNIDDMIQVIKELHSGFPLIYNPKEVISVFIQTLNIRNKDVIEKSFRHLEKEGRIKVNESYNIKFISGQYESINQLEYENIVEYIKGFLQSKNVTYYAYSHALTSIHKTKKMIQTINEVTEFLSDHFNIEYVFKSFGVTIIDKTIKKDVTKEQFLQAYFTRLIKLSKDRQGKQEYNNSLSFWKRFYLLNTFTLLDYIHVNNIRDLIKTEKKLYSQKVDEYSLDLMINHFESDIEREKKRHSFGNN